MRNGHFFFLLNKLQKKKKTLKHTGQYCEMHAVSTVSEAALDHLCQLDAVCSVSEAVLRFPLRAGRCLQCCGHHCLRGGQGSGEAQQTAWQHAAHSCSVPTASIPAKPQQAFACVCAAQTNQALMEAAHEGKAMFVCLTLKPSLLVTTIVLFSRDGLALE